MLGRKPKSASQGTALNYKYLIDIADFCPRCRILNLLNTEDLRVNSENFKLHGISRTFSLLNLNEGRSLKSSSQCNNHFVFYAITIYRPFSLFPRYYPVSILILIYSHCILFYLRETFFHTEYWEFFGTPIASITILFCSPMFTLFIRPSQFL